MKANMIETVLGGVVLLVAAVFVVFAYSSASLGTSSGYEVKARFDRVGDLKAGDDVKISGIRVGSVVGQSLDPKTYQAVVTLAVDPSVQLPTDTAAEIALSGLLGGSYVNLSPGGAERNIPPGGEITVTQSAVDLVGLIGKAMFSSKGGLEGEAAPPGAGGTETPGGNPLLAPPPMPGTPAPGPAPQGAPQQTPQ